MNDDDIGSVSSFPKPKARPLPVLKEGENFISLPLDPEEEYVGDEVTYRQMKTWLAKTTKLLGVKIVDKFRDDNLPCYNVILINQENEPIGASFWWMDDSMIEIAEGKSILKARKELLELAKDEV